MIDLLQSSPNYDKIVNFLYEENDDISKLLIDYYQQYLFNIKSNKSKSNIDNIMNIYTEKTDFYKYVQQYFKENDDIYDTYDRVIKKLNKLYKNYDEEKLKKINNARWL